MRISDWSSEVCSSDLLQEGLSMARHAQVDFALLDVNLAGEQSFPIADVLTGRGIHFAFVTGYGRRGVESRAAAVPVVQKAGSVPGRGSALQYEYVSVVAVTIKRNQKTLHNNIT